MHKFFRMLKLLLSSILITLMLSQSASAISGQTSAGAALAEMLFSGLDCADRIIEQQIRGFRAPSSMNFGGGKGAAKSSSANKTNSANTTNSANKTNSADKTNNANSSSKAAQSGTKKRSGLLGFLGGLGMMGLLFLGAGLFGGGFLIYLLIMMLLPVILSYFGRRKAGAQAGGDIPTAGVSGSRLFGSEDDKRNEADKDRKDDADFDHQGRQGKSF